MDFKDKQIAVLGAGIEGISTAKYLVKHGAKVEIFDSRSESDFQKRDFSSLQKGGVAIHFESRNSLPAKKFDCIFRSPSVHPDLKVIKESKENGVFISSQIKLFFDLCPGTIIGVTGTKGKGTTSSLIYEILKKDGRKVFLGGNIGNPPLDFIDEVTKDSLVVLELSSFQLMDLHKSPSVAVVLMATSEHLDWHKDREEYLKAKENLVRYQTAADRVIINNDFPASKMIGQISKAKKYFYSVKEQNEANAYFKDSSMVISNKGEQTTINAEKIRLPGLHNRQNILAASLTAFLSGVDTNKISEVVNSFTGLPHRLEFVADVGGVKFYDDSASTIPETTIAAINSFQEPKILIAGGSSKESDFTDLGRAIADTNLKAVLLIGDEAPRIKKAIEAPGDFKGILIEGLNSMSEAVNKAKDLSRAGDIVLLSPACASFGLFKNYKERGEFFKREVSNLSSRSTPSI